ncbi:hypothetical protein [Fodinicola acaciae]|uniref:hypothetical protein n=1 Tax=Fodinicola acaciae TaxID=2681555 RepID=UPI001C9E4A85|nr:hypothetical protein [Fodinicola acaciae]
MIHLLAPAVPGDLAVREIARITARLSYVMMCAALCWGLLVNPAEERRWSARLLGVAGKTAAHLVFATLALAFGAVHAAMFAFLSTQFPVVRLVVPFADGGLARHALGIVGIETVLVAAVSTAVRRFLGIRKWLFVHRLVYPATVLVVAHSAFGAWANGDFVLLAPIGLPLLVPVCWLGAKRLIARYDVRRENAPTEMAPRSYRRPPRLAVSVSHERCHRYGFCQQDAGQVFHLREDGHLDYVARPHPSLNGQVRMAARNCPMRAISVDEI